MGPPMGLWVHRVDHHFPRTKLHENILTQKMHIRIKKATIEVMKK